MTLSLTVRRWKALCRKSLQLRAVLAQSRALLDDANTVTAYAKDMKDFLNESELTERRAFIQSFVKDIIVVPGDALLKYTVPHARRQLDTWEVSRKGGPEWGCSPYFTRWWTFLPRGVVKTMIRW